MGSTWALHGAPEMSGESPHPVQLEVETSHRHLPGHVLRYALGFKDPIFEHAFAEGTPSALLIKDLEFVSIGNVNVVRPRQTGPLHFRKHCEVCPRVVNLSFDLPCLP